MPGYHDGRINACIIYFFCEACFVFNAQAKGTSCNHWHPALYIVNNMPGNFKPFIFTDTEHFTAKAICKKTFHACSQIKFDEAIQSIKVNLSLQVERRYHYRNKFFFISI